MAFVIGVGPNIRELVKALKLPPQVSRFVLEFQVGEPMRCYAVHYPTEDTLNPLVDFVKSISVDENATVAVKPLTMTANWKRRGHSQTK